MTPTLEVSLDDGFLASLTRLDPAKSHRVLEAVTLLQNNPDHPNLHLKPLHGDLSQLWSARAGRDVRMLLVRRGDTVVLLEAGMRRDIYDKAARGRFVVNPNRRFMGFVDIAVPTEERREPLPSADRPSRTEQPSVFDHWRDAELVEAGLTDEEVAALRACHDEYDLLALPWPDDRIDLVVAMVETTPEAWARRHDADDQSEARIRAAIADFGGLTGISPLLDDEVLAKLAAAPVEDWMIFLHPDQRGIIESTPRGPARVRGAAGTGKTVVALHRAAELARRYRHEQIDSEPSVLFATVVPGLGPVLESLYRRLPGSPPDVEFRDVDGLASSIVERHEGVAPIVAPAAVDEAFDLAWRGANAAGGPVVEMGLTPSYVRTEIERVIKGRGLTNFEQYRSVVRVGRRQGLTGSAREQIWTISQQWDEAMAGSGTSSWPDVTIRALAAVRRDGARTYRCVVVDEAQDLTMVGLDVLRSLANGGGPDRPDGLFLAGDGAQRIYAGGFTLRQAGVEVRGRTTVLRVNYRNTREIMEAALATLGDEEVTDLDEEFRRGEQAPVAIRSGGRPLVERCVDADAEIGTVVRLVTGADAHDAVAFGDVAVLLPSQTEADSWSATLDDSGVPCIPLSRYRGLTEPSVKVGTHAQSKGLEFKVVVLPGLGAGHFPPPRREREPLDEWRERRSLALSHLFVAMTRARDLLSITCVGEPADELTTLVTDDGHGEPVHG